MTAIFYTSNVSIQLLFLPADPQNVTTGYIYKTPSHILYRLLEVKVFLKCFPGRLSENSFVARASENFSGKAARPNYRKRSCACGEKALISLTQHVEFAATRSTERSTKLTPKSQQKSILEQPPRDN